MIPLYSGPLQHWWSHSRRWYAGFWSGRPGILASPPRSAPCRCPDSQRWLWIFFLQAKQLTCPSNFAQTFTFIGHWHNLGARGDGLYHYAKGWTPTVLRPTGINVKLIKIIIRIGFIWSSSHWGHRCWATFSCNYCPSSITHMGVAREGGLILFQSNSTTLSHTSSPFCSLFLTGAFLQTMAIQSLSRPAVTQFASVISGNPKSC